MQYAVYGLLNQEGFLQRGMLGKIVKKLLLENPYAMKKWYWKEEVAQKDHTIMQIHKVLTITQQFKNINCNLE